MICHKQKVIFTHIPKTAGTSILDTLGKVNKKQKLILSKPDHSTLAEIKDRDLDDFWHYYKFTVVRNPWEREWSLYKFLKIKDSFEDYLKNMQNDKSYYVEKRKFKLPNLFANQVDFILINNQIELDQIIRFENLNNGYRELCKAIGKEVVDLPHLRKSSSKSYAHNYSNECINLVSELREKDITFLNYSF